MQQGDVINNRYEVLELLGEGAQGEVWKTRDRREGDLAAVKVLPPDQYQEDVKHALRLQREAEILKDLDSEHVIKVREFGQTRTVRYRAPEQIPQRGGNAEIGPTTDTYSAGAILYYLLTGRAPFVAPAAPTIQDPPEHWWAYFAELHVRKRRRPRFRGELGIDGGLQQIVRRATSYDQAERFQSARELAEALEPFLEAPTVPSGAAPNPLPPTAVISVPAMEEPRPSVPVPWQEQPASNQPEASPDPSPKPRRWLLALRACPEINVAFGPLWRPVAALPEPRNSAAIPGTWRLATNRHRSPRCDTFLSGQALMAVAFFVGGHRGRVGRARFNRCWSRR